MRAEHDTRSSRRVTIDCRPGETIHDPRAHALPRARPFNPSQAWRLVGYGPISTPGWPQQGRRRQRTSPAHSTYGTLRRPIAGAASKRISVKERADLCPDRDEEVRPDNHGWTCTDGPSVKVPPATTGASSSAFWRKVMWL